MSPWIFLANTFRGLMQAVREEKWLAECEKDALRRDLDSATQRCEQMQQDTTTEALPRTYCFKPTSRSSVEMRFTSRIYLDATVVALRGIRFVYSAWCSRCVSCTKKMNALLRRTDILAVHPFQPCPSPPPPGYVIDNGTSILVGS